MDEVGPPPAPAVRDPPAESPPQAVPAPGGMNEKRQAPPSRIGRGRLSAFKPRRASGLAR
ncbi:MAG: hypothetical protein GC129_04130 [Proteobacteria bacterium]|nr:hypothetical protein [Pseudomonadota bacterium]